VSSGGFYKRENIPAEPINGRLFTLPNVHTKLLQSSVTYALPQSRGINRRRFSTVPTNPLDVGDSVLLVLSTT
jgi:hypothetical protein